MSTTLVRTAALGAATLLCAAATAAVGPIAFIGLAVPHIVRGLLGLDMRRQLIGCLLVGPVVLLGADIVGRVLLRPQELMVGVVTAFVGAPILLLAVRRLGRRAQA
ncbi:iron chelate uptake ABC transporter family permease subunit [Janibacter hoylei]|uniref:iron chelate uptake ABC transporter family permease subunit n=1 Tax=Janibacter hoylei TaxID=364298 RepID=UPI00030C4C37|nr:iron chelate uptake ABC transporter family permease subunit [Janibacter hoylei]